MASIRLAEPIAHAELAEQIGAHSPERGSEPLERLFAAFLRKPLDNAGPFESRKDKAYDVLLQAGHRSDCHLGKFAICKAVDSSSDFKGVGVAE